MSDPTVKFTPTQLLVYGIDPMMKFLEMNCDVLQCDEARVEVLCIAGQESNWDYRRQIGGPARSLWQFEKGGGVHGVLTHAASKDKIRTVCDFMGVPCDEDTVYEAMAWNSFLGAAMARLLLFTDAAALPALGATQQAWNYYERIWRPGAPHPEVWPGYYQESLQIVQKNPLG